MIIYLKEYIDWDDDKFYIEEEEEDPIKFGVFINHQKFYNFLIKYNILEKYIHNFNIEFSEYGTLKMFLEEKEPIYYISHSFDWSLYNYRYWMRISNLWADEIKTMIY